MAHFAQINENSIVTQVVVADTKEWCEENLGGVWIQTSYNTRQNQHILGGEPLRANFAGKNFIYDPVDDVFYEPQPYPSWTLDRDKFIWISPVPFPEDGKDYRWNEDIADWEEVVY